MRSSLVALFALLGCSCFTGPVTMRQMNLQDTAEYTECGQVQVDCVDEACSNMKAQGWTATACGQRYRCTRAAGHVGCAPLDQK